MSDDPGDLGPFGELISPVPDRRLEALRSACLLYQGTREAPFVVIRAAEQFLTQWLGKKPHRLVLTPAPNTFQQGNPARHNPTKHLGDGMSVQMNDDQQVTYSVAAKDDKGFDVSDAITWSADDGGAVLTVTTAPDSMSATFAAVAPGTATVTASDGTLSASDLITVTPGDVASLVLNPGAVEAQPAPPSA